MNADREAEMATVAARIRRCAECDGMNIAGLTQAAPGYGSLTSPIVLVGQSLCGPCMASQIPFTGGSGRILDKAFEEAGVKKSDIFVTNIVHCHPPNNRPSHPHEIANCRTHLRNELAIVQPSLILGLGKDARASLEGDHPNALVHKWPFQPPSEKPSAHHPELLFAPHPSWVVRQPRPVRERYIASLASALTWVFQR
ncbi:uracil-DNA glycosylase [Mycolicibacterium senegalense]|uniref:uracil-DNA glycosylase n=1 Tax=Mycolicibacterium senegalense TaxID=1796 RepID=UPI003625BF4F